MPPRTRSFDIRLLAQSPFRPSPDPRVAAAEQAELERRRLAAEAARERGPRAEAENTDPPAASRPKE
jgi:hypothetical protein